MRLIKQIINILWTILRVGITAVAAVFIVLMVLMWILGTITLDDIFVLILSLFIIINDAITLCKYAKIDINIPFEEVGFPSYEDDYDF